MGVSAGTYTLKPLRFVIKNCTRWVKNNTPNYKQEKSWQTCVKLKEKKHRTFCQNCTEGNLWRVQNIVKELSHTKYPSVTVWGSSETFGFNFSGLKKESGLRTWKEEEERGVRRKNDEKKKKKEKKRPSTVTFLFYHYWTQEVTKRGHKASDFC